MEMFKLKTGSSQDQTFKVRMTPMKFLVPKVDIKIIEKALLAENNDVSGAIIQAKTDDKNKKEIDRPQIWRDKAADSLIKKIDEAKNKYNVLYDEFGKELFDKIGYKIRITDSLVWAAKKQSGGQYVTRAWLKFYEIYCHFKFLEELISADKYIFAFLNAELPGASICALNHYIKTKISNEKIEFDWRGSSYVSQWDDNSTSSKTNFDEKPGDNINIKNKKFEHEKSSISLEDKYGIWENNKDKWLMEKGVNNGDATDIENLLDFRQKLCSNSFSFQGNNKIDKNETCRPNLYSHDAGIDVSISVRDDIFGGPFENQEARNARVHLGCAISGLITLKIGGMFVAKQYSILERLSIDLLIIYAAMFDEFYLFKPVTSGVSNSEIYLIGIRFNGLPQSIKEAIFGRLDNFSFRPMLGYIPHNKLEQTGDIYNAAKKIYEFEKEYAEEQIEFIIQDIKYYKLGREDLRNLDIFDPIKYNFTKKFLKDNELKRINSVDLIPAGGKSIYNKK